LPATKTIKEPSEVDELRAAIAAAKGHPDAGVQALGVKMLTASERLNESEREVAARTATIESLQATFERIGDEILAGREELDRISAQQVQAILASDPPRDFVEAGSLPELQTARGVAQGQTAQRLGDERRALKIAQSENLRCKAEWFSRYADLATWTAMVAARGAVTWGGAFTITPAPDSRAGNARKQAERYFNEYQAIKSELRLPR
jgi:hypothetical protein